MAQYETVRRHWLAALSMVDDDPRALLDVVRQQDTKKRERMFGEADVTRLAIQMIERFQRLYRTALRTLLKLRQTKTPPVFVRSGSVNVAVGPQLNVQVPPTIDECGPPVPRPNGRPQSPTFRQPTIRRNSGQCRRPRIVGTWSMAITPATLYQWRPGKGVRGASRAAYRLHASRVRFSVAAAAGVITLPPSSGRARPESTCPQSGQFALSHHRPDSLYLTRITVQRTVGPDRNATLCGRAGVAMEPEHGAFRRRHPSHRRHQGRRHRGHRRRRRGRPYGHSQHANGHNGQNSNGGSSGSGGRGRMMGQRSNGSNGRTVARIQ